MSSVDTTPRDVKAIIARYRAIGLYGGIAFGGVIGTMLAGPNFREWSWIRSVVTLAGSVGVGALVGYFAGELAVGGQGAGPGSVMHSGENHSSSGPSGLDASGGGDGGGDGSGGGDH